MRTLSPSVPIGASVVDTMPRGMRNGSDTPDPLPSRHMSAPGSKARRSSEATSSWRLSSGYAVSSTWKPRSTTKPSITSVRTRPPTVSPASNTMTSTPASCSDTAQASPARPHPRRRRANRNGRKRARDGSYEDQVEADRRLRRRRNLGRRRNVRRRGCDGGRRHVPPLHVHREIDGPSARRRLDEAEPAEEHVLVLDPQTGTTLALRRVGTLFAPWMAWPRSK